MSEELNPSCPFCGSKMELVIYKSPKYQLVSCENEDCPIAHIIIRGDRWKQRPIEDAIRKKLEIAVEALKFYASCIRDDAGCRAQKALDEIEKGEDNG